MGGVYGFLCYAALFVVVVLAAFVFAYKYKLTNDLATNRANLETMRNDALSGVAQDYVSLDGKLKTAATLLNAHVSLSHFLSLLSDELPVGVRLSALQMNIGDDGKVAVSGTGVAKNFNTLAVASGRFASKGDLAAVFSKLSVAKDNSVGFALSAVAQPEMTAFVAPQAEPEQATSSAEAATSSASMP